MSGPWEEFQSAAPAGVPQAANAAAPWEEYGGKPAPAPAAGAFRRVADTGLALAKGVIGVPEAAVGVADLVTGGQAGKLAEQAGVRFKDAKQVLTDLQSPEQHAADAAVQQADGFLPTLGAMVQNPSTIINAAAESAPSMVLGGAAGRGAMALAPRLGAIGAGALGEGVVAAGQNAEQVRQEDPNGTLTPQQAAILAASGAVTGGLSLGAGQLANKLGIGDVTTMLTAGKLGPVGEEAAAAGVRKGAIRRVAEGAAVEGALQELPQSYQEQVAQNLAQGKPWDEGAGAAGAQGLLTGGLTGGLAGPLAGHAPAPAAGPIERAAAAMPMLPAPTIAVDSEGTAATADQRQAQRPPQVRGNVVDVTPVAEAPPQEFPMLPAPAITVDSVGEARTTAQRNLLLQGGDVTDVVAKPSKSEQMGISPAAGPLSASAARAVDSGLSEAMQASQAAEQQAAEAAKQPAAKPPKPGEADFATAEQAQGYISSQKRAGGMSIQALPLPKRDGTFGIAIKGSPDYTIAEFHQKQQTMRAAGMLDGDILNKSGEFFKSRIATSGPLRKAGPGHQVVPVQGGFVIRAESVQPAAAKPAQVPAAAPPAPQKAPAPAAAPAQSAAPAAKAAATSGPEQVYQQALAKIQTEYEATPNALKRDAAKAKAKKAFEKAMKAPPAAVSILKKGPARDQNLPPAAAAKTQAAPVETPKAAGGPAVGAPAAGATAGPGGLEAARVTPQTDETATQSEKVVTKAVSSEVPPKTEIDESAHTAKVQAITGEKLDKEWTAFAPDSGTLSVPRADMPQIRAVHRGAMVNFLNARGIAHQQEEVPASSLKPTQAEFSPGRVAQAKGYTDTDRSILVSADGHVLDGHHQWLAKMEAGEPVKVIRLDAPIKQLLDTVKEFPSAQLAGGATAAASPAPTAPAASKKPAVAPEPPASKSIVQKRLSKAKQAIVDAEARRAKYFTPGNIVRGYGGFDEVLSYSPPDANGRWNVKVHEVIEQDGKWVRVGKPQNARNHSTEPRDHEYRTGPRAKVEPAPGADVIYSAPRADGSQFPDAPRRGPVSVTAPTKDQVLAGIRDTLRAKATDTENPGDVGLQVGDKIKFIPFDDAVKAAKAAVAAGVKAVPFQIHNETNIRLGDTDRVIAAIAKPSADFDNVAQQARDFDVAAMRRFLGATPAGMSVKDVQAAADRIGATWTGGPRVVVLPNTSQSPIPVNKNSRGLLYQGTSYLFAENITDEHAVARTMAHEAIAHHGLRQMLGPVRWVNLMRNINKGIESGDADLIAHKAYVDEAYKDENLSPNLMADEIAARVVEDGVDPATGQFRPNWGFVKEIYARIAEFLRARLGLKIEFSNAELQGMLRAAMQNLKAGKRTQGGNDLVVAAARGDTPVQVPRVTIGNPLGSATSHPDYEAAKAGNTLAAVRVAKSLVTDDLVQRVRDAIGDKNPLVVPVVSEEATGRNQIPRAAAILLANKLGLKAATDVVQSNRAHRTALAGLDRIFAGPDFEGKVEPGRSYLLVDDTLTQGATFASLASHIEDNGGLIAGAVALTGKEYSATLQPTPETLAKLREKHGDLESDFRAATGYGFDALTQSEARYLANFEPADAVRDRILAERREKDGSGDSGDSGRGQAALDIEAPMMALDTAAGAARFTNLATEKLNNLINVPGRVNWWHKSFGTMYNLAQRSEAFKPVFEAAQNFVNDVSFYATEAADMAPRILPKLETWADIRRSPIKAADNKAISAPIFEGTLIWGRDETGKPAKVEDLQAAADKLTPQEKAQRMLRAGKITEGVLKMWQGQPVDQYESAVKSRFDSVMLKPGVVFTDAELRSMFKLNDEQISLYREFRAGTDASLDSLARADMLRYGGDDVVGLRDQVMEAKDAGEAAVLLRDYLLSLAKSDPGRNDLLVATATGMIDKAEKVEALKREGYAPLTRFGKYTVDVVVDGNREYFSLFESPDEAAKVANKMRMLYGKAAVTQGTLSNDAFKMFAGVTPESLELFGNMLGLDTTGDQARDKVFQEYLKNTKNNRSAMRRLIHRKGIAGYSEDAGRVLASFIYSNARQTSAALHIGDLGKAVTEIPKQQGELIDVAVSLADYVKNPQEEAQAVRGLLFAQYLGGSVASALVNMTQPLAVTFPYLSQFGGAKQSGRELTRAYRDLANSKTVYEPKLAAALKHAEESGIVSPQEVHQLMAQARGAGSLKSGDGTRTGDALAAGSNALSRLALGWGKVFGIAEQLNRRTTFIAAFRIAESRNMANPAAFAEKAVNETQFIYSKANKMRFGRGAIGGTLMTFKTYSIAYLELMHRMATQGGPEGKKAALLGIGVLFLLSGAGGLPFSDDIMDLVDGALQRLGYNISSKKAKQEFLEGLFGKAGADFVDRGITGLPGVPLDVSGRLGMGNLIPGTGLFQQKANHGGDLAEIAGPMGDFVKRVAEGGSQLLSGDVGKAALTVAPTAVRNAAKGADMADTGTYRDAKGYKVLDTTMMEAALKAIGFQPQSVSKVQEANYLNQRAKDFYNITAQDIRARWAKGIFEKDPEQVAQAREMIETWNRDNPDQRMTANLPAILKKAREMGKPKDQRIADTAPKAMREQMRRDVADLRSELR